MELRSRHPAAKLVACALWSHVGMALTLLPLMAAAQPLSDDATRAAARQLGEQGIEAYWADDFASADAKLERAFRLFPTPTLGLWSARARTRLGQLLEAAERYREAIRASAALGDGTAQRQAQLDAKIELDQLTPRIPSITLALEGADPASVLVSLDGSPLPSALIGTGRPTNPGVHQLSAVRGEERYERQLELAETQHVTASFHFQTRAPAAQPAPRIDPAAATSHASQATPGAHAASPTPAAGIDPMRPRPAQAPWRPIAVVAMAVGVASLLGSGAIALVANGKRADDCPDNVCSSHDAKQYDSLKTVSTLTFYAGAALAVGGLVTWFVAPAAEQTRDSRVRWDLGPNGTMVSGAF